MESENITKGISSLGQWKERLANAIWCGTSDFNPEVLSLPDRCELGKWLHAMDKPPDAKDPGYHQKAVDLHAQFHAEASTILRLALKGDMVEAEKLMAPDSKFASLSAALTELLNEWKAA